MTTTLPDARNAGRQWVLIDAKGLVLGRLASRVAQMLRGKHKVLYTPFLDAGDFVVVINAEQIAVTGQKRSQKQYQRYSGYPGGQRSTSLERMLKTHPDRVLRKAVKGMMPAGPLSRRMLGKLKIVAGPNHPYAAQQPQPVNPALLPGVTNG